MAGPAPSSVPLHHQIAQVLPHAHRVWSLVQRRTARPEQTLCEEFRVSRTTVRQALSQLKQIGLLHSRRGVGTHGVAPPASKVARSSGNPLHAALQTRARVQASAPSRHRDRWPRSSAFPRAARCFASYACTSSTARRVGGGFLPAYALRYRLYSHDVSKSVHELLWRRFRLRQRRSVHAIRVARADMDVAGLLGIALADPVLRVQSSVYFPDGKPIRWIENFFREERYKYVPEWSGRIPQR